MRALTIIYVFGFIPRIGGHQRSALGMVAGLEGMGHHVMVLAPGGPAEMAREFVGTGAEFLSIPQLGRHRRFLPATCGAGRILGVARERAADVIHSQDFDSIGPAYLAAVLGKKAFVYTKAGGPWAYHMPPRQAETVVFSRELADGVPAAYRLAKDNLHLVRARINTDVFRPGEVDPTFIRKYGLPASGKKVVVAMRLELPKMVWLKTVLGAAKAVSASPSRVHLILAGEGPLLAELKRKAAGINRKRAQGPVLHLVGPIFNSREINQFYNYADLAVGTGRGILEAMACRKPVIVLGEKGEAEVVGPENIEEVAYFNFSGRHFRYRAKSSVLLSDLLGELLDDADTRKRLGDYSYDYIRTRMDARVGARQLVEVYERALGNRSSLIDYAWWSTQEVFTRLRLSVRIRFPSAYGTGCARPVL